MVVLSVGLNPPVDVNGLAKQFGVELNKHNFCKLNPVNPMETNQQTFEWRFFRVTNMPNRSSVRAVPAPRIQ